MVPFHDVEIHLKSKSCDRTRERFSDDEIKFCIHESLVGKEHESTWATTIIIVGDINNRNIFFLRMRRIMKQCEFELVMKGTQEDCDKFSAAISVLDSSNRAVFTSYYNPRPLDTVKWGEFSLVVNEKALSKIWVKNLKSFEFVVSVKITEETK